MCTIQSLYNADTGPDDKPPSSAEPGAESSSGADTPDPIDPFLGLINDEKRLRSKSDILLEHSTHTVHSPVMLETHNLPPSLPPHLLGSLGLRMPHIFQKSMSSSNSKSTSMKPQRRYTLLKFVTVTIILSPIYSS